MRLTCPLTSLIILNLCGCGGGVSSSVIVNTPTQRPTVSTAYSDLSTISITGENFGVKTISPPYYFSNFDNETTGQMPSGQISNLAAGQQGLVKSNIYRGAKSLEFNYSATAGIKQGDWKRNAIDLGKNGSDKIFLSYWLYLDKGTSTCKSWQWKNTVVTSNSNLYVSLKDLESVIIHEPWYFNNTSWGNSGSPHLYYWDSAASAAKLSFSNGAASDTFLFGQWQRIDLYVQRSSVGLAADGQVIYNRVGRSSPMISKTNVVTHDVGDDPWRYVTLSNAVESVLDGFVDLKVYMDDVYVDTSQARVELCNTSTWAARTHCEIQPATSWTNTNVIAILNRGQFNSGITAYLYVVSSDGNVNTTGKSIVLP